MKETIGLSDRNYGQPLLHHRVNIPFYAHYLFGQAPKHLLQLLRSHATERDGFHGFLSVRWGLNLIEQQRRGAFAFIKGKRRIFYRVSMHAQVLSGELFFLQIF